MHPGSATLSMPTPSIPTVPPAINGRDGGPIEVAPSEHQRRLDDLCQWLNTHELSGACLFERVNIVYLTGYHFQQTERPVALIVTATGEVGLLTPALEADHAAATPTVDQVMAYPEYPGLRHPMHYLADLLAHFKLDMRRLTADQAGYPPVWGYQGPTLSKLVGEVVTDQVAPFLLHHRSIKSADVIELIRLSATWGNYAHEIMQQAIRVGANEVEVGQAASRMATLALFEAAGDRYHNHDWGVIPIHVGFKAGPGTAVPHPMGGGRPMQAGDLIVTWATAKMAGYHAELERTLVLGQPSDDQAYYFNAMCQAQATGIAAMRPGVRCAEVDEAVYAFWESQALLPYVRHHTGHGLDMEIHAPPYLDQGEQTILEPGMLFSVEPGLYVPGVGGFRHSDTVLITEEGHEVLTWYPRDLVSLTIPV